MIASQPFAFVMVPDAIENPIWFFTWLTVWLAVWWVVGFVLFRREFRNLRRVPTRLSLRDIFTDAARRHSTRQLRAGRIGSWLFVTGGIFGLIAGHNPIVMVICTTFFAACALAWWYTLRLKREMTGPSTDPGERPS